MTIEISRRHCHSLKKSIADILLERSLNRKLPTALDSDWISLQGHQGLIL